MAWFSKFPRLINIFIRHSNPGLEAVLEKLINQGEYTMASIQDLKDAVANEAGEVKSKLDEQTAKIQALSDLLAAGGSVTSADLDEVKLAIENIFTPSAPEVA